METPKPEVKERLVNELARINELVDGGWQLITHLRNSPLRTAEKAHSIMFFHTGLLWLHQFKAGVEQALTDMELAEKAALDVKKEEPSNVVVLPAPSANEAETPKVGKTYIAESVTTAE